MCMYTYKKKTTTIGNEIESSSPDEQTTEIDPFRLFASDEELLASSERYNSI